MKLSTICNSLSIVILTGLLIYQALIIRELQEDNIDHYKTEILLGGVIASDQDALAHQNRLLYAMQNP